MFQDITCDSQKNVKTAQMPRMPADECFWWCQQTEPGYNSGVEWESVIGVHNIIIKWFKNNSEEDIPVELINGQCSCSESFTLLQVYTHVCTHPPQAWRWDKLYCTVTNLSNYMTITTYKVWIKYTAPVWTTIINTTETFHFTRTGCCAFSNIAITPPLVGPSSLAFHNIHL